VATLKLQGRAMTANTKPAHAKYGASSAHRWGACAGSTTLVLDGKRVDASSRYAAEGTLGHTLAAKCLTDNVAAARFIGNPYNVDNFAFIVDADFAAHLQTYVDNIREYAVDASLMVEVEVDYSKYLGVKPVEGFGTSDVVILRSDELQVHDLKMGQGEVVEAEGNWQMMLYALGAYEQYGELLDYDAETKVTMVIHQPRIRKAPTEWSCTVGDLFEFGAQMKLAAHADKAALWGHAAYRNGGRKPEEFKAWSDKYLVPGEKQCRWCSAKAMCPAVRDVVTKTVFNATPVDASEFKAMTFVPKIHVHPTGNDWLSSAMKQVPLIRDWIKAVTAEIDRRVLGGQQIEGFKVVMGDQGDRAWSSEAAAEVELKSMRLKQDEMYSRKLISPTMAEKLTKGKTPAIGERQWKKLGELIQRAPGAPRVVPEGHKAPAIVVAAVDDEFDNLESQSLADDIG